ncbi:TPA: hypothetical protein TZ285_000994 [Streptococcus suis]|nr:hypothetical protein [Streptococcus suis]
MVHTVTFNQAMLAKDRVFAIRAGAYTSSDIKEASFNYGYISGDTLKPGGTVAGSAKLTFTSIITSFNKLDKVYPEIGLKVGDSFEWVAMGEYFVNDINIDRNRNTTELDLMDGMFKLNQPYISDLTYPAQIRDVIREICVKTGVELETDDLGFRAIQHHIQSKADKKDITFREVLSQAIQLLGFSAFFNRKGKLEIRGLTESNITITADNYFLHGLTKSELMYQIAGITCKKDKETLTVGLRTGRSLELENSFMIQNILDDLYYDLKEIKYYPFSLDWQGHLKLDVGQWITLKTNKNETFKVPVLSQSFNFKGGLKSKISADSKAGNDTQYSYKGFLGKRIEQMSTEIEAEVQQQLEYKDKEFDEKINKAKSEINDGIEQSKAEAERYADAIKQEIDTEIAQVNQSMQAQSEEHDRQVADILSKTQSVESLANQAKSDAASALARANQVKTEAIADARAQVATVSQALNTAKSELQTAIASADQKARDSQASATALRNDLNLQASKILEQARAQTALTNRVTTVETLADGTRSTVAELSKTVNKATGDITSVTARTKTVEDTLSQTRTQYEALTQTVNAQTGQIESINRKTADLQSGIDGVTERFENLRVGATNYIRDFGFAKNHNFNSNQSSWQYERIEDGTARSGYHIKATCTQAGWGGFHKPLYDLRWSRYQGRVMTYSVDVKASKSVRMRLGAEAFSKSLQIFDTTTDWQRFISTDTVGYSTFYSFPFYTDGTQWQVGDVIYLRDPQLEDGNVATTPHAAEEDLRSEFATYVRNASENSAELIKRIETADGKAVDAKSYAQQTATAINARLESLETYKDAEGTRAQAYFEASKTETAKQLTAERTVISTNYVAKSTYIEDARGNTQRINEIRATADTAKQNLATYQETVDRKLTELTSSAQTLDGKINTASAKVDTVAGQIRTEISEVEGKIPTEIGGRNYFRGYKYNEEITLNSYQNVGSFTQFYNRLTYNLPESDGKTFTISFEAISPNGETPLEVYNRNNDPQYFYFPSRRIGIVGTIWQKLTRTVTVSTQNVSNTTNSNKIEIYAPNKTGVRVRNIKVELGNIATDWSPAPEDVVTEIENVKTIITQTAEGQQQLSTRLTEIQGKVMTTETSIEQLVGDVSSKVSQTTFDNLKRTVDSQATSISQNQSDIALKAEKTYVDGVKATADSAKSTASDALTKANANADSIKTTQAELKVTSDAVKTKVTRTDFDKVDGRLRTAESTIVTQAGEIEKRLTSTQVETAISNKGYQTKADVDKNITDRGFATSTTVQNIVKETSEIFNRSISRVESSIPTDYDNQNLWIKSKSSGYSAIEKLPDNHISGQSECYRLNNGTQLIFNIEPEFSSRLYQKVTFSAWVKYNNVVRGSNAWNVFNCFKHVIYRKNSKTGVKSSVAYTTPVAFEGTSDWKYISFTIDYSTQSQYDQLKTSLAFRMENAASGTAWVTGVKVELGSKATRYNLAVEDTVTVTSFNSVSDTVSSHTQTLSEQGKSISQVIQTAQGLVTRIDNLSVGGRNLFKGYKYNEEITLNNYQGVGSFTQFYNRLTYNLPDAGGKEFTISFEAISPNGDTPINVYNDNGAPQYFRFPGQILGTAGATWQKFSRTVTVATQTVSNTTNSNKIEIYAPNKTGVRVRNIKVELGNIATDWSPAPEDNDSAVQAVSTQVNTLAGSWSVQNLNSSGDILSQANLSSAQFLLEAAKIRLKGKTLADEIKAIDGKFGTLFVADGTFAKLNAAVIGSQAITADKLKVDQAFFDKLMANDAYLRQLFAKSVFTTQVQAVAVSAKQIAGGIAKALNGGMDVNFDESKINFYTNVAAIRRIYTGHPTQFIKFETEGNYSRTIIGSNRNGGEVFNSATFAGIVVENTNNINTEDSVKIYGDNTLLRHAQGDVGWNINSVTQRIVPANINEESEIWSKHFVAPDKNSKPVRLDTAVAALWDIWNHIIYNNFEFNEALRTHIKARRDNWKFELNL